MTYLATFFRQLSEGSAYYRLYTPAKHLPGKVIWPSSKDLQQTRDPLTGMYSGDYCFPTTTGTAIWQFPGNRRKMLIMIGQRRKGYKVVVEVDDNYLVPPPPIPNAKKRPWLWSDEGMNTDEHTHVTHREIVHRVAEHIICSTPFLADVYWKFTKNRNIHVCRNAIDPEDWPEPEKPDDGILRIGWSGSSSHLADTRHAARALDWASRQSKVEIVMIGDVGLHKWGFPFKHIKWADDLTEYRKNLALLDVGICPLTRSTWNDCKSDIKAMEYAMAGAMPVVQKSPAYEEWFKDFPSADNEKEWKRVLKDVVASRGKVRARADEAKEYVLTERDINKTVREWREVCES